MRVKHFEVVVDAAAALDVSPQLQQQFDELSGELPDVLTYDVYVDEQNQIRRTTNELEAGGSKLTTDIVIKQVTEPIVIEVPAAEDVTDINDLIWRVHRPNGAARQRHRWPPAGRCDRDADAAPRHPR